MGLDSFSEVVLQTHVVGFEEAVKLCAAGRAVVWMLGLLESFHLRFDRVGMRFETSQTTPSFLDRRLQLRMLSFVGLISVVLVTLSLINKPPAAQPNRGASGDAESLTFQPLQEERNLKPDEVIILANAEDDGPRGQWADASSDNSRDGAAQDRGLFKPRNKERAEEGQFFPRRNSAATTREEARLRDEPLADETPPARLGQPLEEIPSEDLRPAIRLDPDQPPTAGSHHARDGNVSDLIFRKRVTDRARETSPDRSRGESLSFEGATSSQGDFVQPNDDTSEPFRENPPADVPSRNVAPRDDDFPQGTPLRQRPLRNPVPIDDPVNELDPIPEGIDQGAPAAPVDRRRSKDLWISDDANGEPVREDVAPVRIDKRYLDLVKDNTMGIRRDESEAFYWLLDHARRVPTTKLEGSGLREVQYINLMTEPDRFRGEPITIEGDLWRLYEFDAGRNDYGVSRVYEGWVFTGDSANHPYRIVFTSLPKGIVPGENLRKPVRITGYFFKREGYRSNGGVHIAPTLLARRIAINPMPNGIPLTAGIVPYMIGVIMAVGLALLVTIVAFAIGDERSTRAGLQRIRRQPHLSFADLAVPTLIPVEESLRQYAEYERQSALSGAYGPLLSRQTAREHGVKEYKSSPQNQLDDGLRRHQRQTNAVHDWAARQKEIQTEIQSLQGAKNQTAGEKWRTGDELDSDMLDPARHVLPKAPTYVPPVLAPEATTSAAHFPLPLSLTPEHDSRASFVGGASNVTHLHSVNPPQHFAAAPMPSNISYGASKLSEWEEEVTKLNNRANKRLQVSDRPSPSLELSAAAQIEHDRLAREQEIRERLHRQQIESEQHRREQQERERIEQERLERARLHHEQLERDRLARERSSYEFADDDSMTFSLAHSPTTPTVSEQLERERLEREQAEHEHRERERMNRERDEQVRLEHAHQERIRHERERLERERYEHERQEHERHEHERHEHLERERIAHEQAHTHREYDRHSGHVEEPLSGTSDSHSLSGPTETPSGSDAFRTSGKRSGRWGWSRKKNGDVAETTGDADYSDEAAGDATDDDTNTGGPSSSGWGRSRKRRRN